jgi:EpsI family protein
VHVLPVLSCACALAFLAGRSRPATAFAAFAAVPLTLLSGALLAASRPASQAVVDWLLPASGMLTLCALAAGVATLAPRPARDRRQPRPLLPASAPTALAAALLIGAVVGAGWLVAPQRPLMDSIPREPFSRFPPEIGAWSGTSVALSRRVERVLRADDYLSTIYYKAGSPAPVELFSAFNHSQARGEWIHPPEVCLPNDGWSIEDRELVSVGPGHAAGATLQLNRAVIVKPGERRLVYYWFVVSGKRMASEIAARLYSKYQRAVTGRSDGALVRLVTPLVPGEAPGAADARLRDFLGATARLLPRFVPETGSDP